MRFLDEFKRLAHPYEDEEEDEFEDDFDTSPPASGAQGAGAQRAQRAILQQPRHG